MPPLIGEKELGFSEVIGEFDSMLDTLYDENNVGDEGLLSGSGIVQELHKAHKCQRYVSSCNNAQKIIRESGVFFGPNEVKDYEKKIAEKATAATKTSSKLQEVTIPSNFGTMTLQKLLDGKIIFPAKSKNLQPITRGWTLKDFWEYTSWPRDASGSLNARFGLPVMPDIENISFDEEVKEAVEALKKKEEKAEPVNPFVTNVKGLEGLEKEIISSNSTCVLFLSAAYCRTCKILNPQYTRMARINEEEESDEENKIIFAKAETGSKIGKALGKSLEVNAVPSFVLFRDGKRYGSPLSISRIPSKKLNKAIEYLSSGMEWDDKLFRSLKS